MRFFKETKLQRCKMIFLKKVAKKLKIKLTEFFATKLCNRKNKEFFAFGVLIHPQADFRTSRRRCLPKEFRIFMS